MRAQLTARARYDIAHATVAETPAIVAAHEAAGATNDHTFYESLAPLDRAACPNFAGARRTVVVTVDSFAAARDLIRNHGAEARKTAVLNLASDLAPGGYWLQTLCETQEEALCYSSTLFATLDPSHYPWPNQSASGIFSPGVVVYKDTIANACRPLAPEDVVVLGVITVAAPRAPRRTQDGRGFKMPEAEQSMREKARAVLRMAAVNGRTNLVLGAMGCGAYGCPKEAVARIMTDVLLEAEFRGWFERVWYAVFDPAGDNNSGIFGEICGNVEFS